MDTVQKKMKRKFDALGAAMSSPHEKKRNTSAGGTPISPERFDLPQIQSFESVRKKDVKGTLYVSWKFHEKKVSSMGTITLHPNEIKEPFKRRGAHTLIGCTHVFYYRGQEREELPKRKDQL